MYPFFKIIFLSLSACHEIKASIMSVRYRRNFSSSFSTLSADVYVLESFGAMVPL